MANEQQQMADDYRLLGQDHTPPDLYAKITGRAMYAEDFRAEGMLFAKLLLSPMPHCRVRNIDASAALAMDGVVGILTADDLPNIPDAPGEAPLTNEPLYEGEPILAVAAVDEETAARAVEAIEVDLEPLPFVIDPLESLRPGGPNARTEGNTFQGRDIGEIKWPEEVFFDAEATGGFPMGEVTDEWSFGDLETGFQQADLVIEQPLFHQTVTHHPMEPRTAFAYWQNGRCYLHAGTQSNARTHAALADALELDLEDLVFISEYCGGGFGSKIYGAYIYQVPALLSRKVGRPVMLRVTRAEETYYGRARPGFQGYARMGFRNDGKVTALDLFLIQENGPYGRQGDYFMAGNSASLMYQPEAMRWRGIAVMTNTPPKAAQRAPGGAQIVALLEPLVDQAAWELGLDRLEMRKLNAPDHDGTVGPARGAITSSYSKEAFDLAREHFNWDEKVQMSGQRNGTKVTGVGLGFSPFVAGSSGYDGLWLIRPDGRLYIHQGIGNLGTHSIFDTARPAVEILRFPWENVEVLWGSSERNHPWSSSQSGSQTTHAHTRANHAACMDIMQKLREVAAAELGGNPDAYEIEGGRVFQRGNRSRGISFARAAELAIEMGGRYDGSELPEDIHSMTVASATRLQGQGLMGVAKDNYSHEGGTWSFVLGCAVVELDHETGVVDLIDYQAVADCGVVLNPRSLAGQVHGGGVQGMGMALSQNWYYDNRWGVPLATRFYTNRPPGILDVPLEMTFAAVDEPDPENPVGAKGIGEPPVGAGQAAVTSAIADAMGRRYLARTPLRPDVILASLEGLELPYEFEQHV
ncbi:MAG: xanthine dehydrogenase family protein molybdopterin-binding subunit [Longimicrobiales bacterium]|nr:xanthine dehydrogenase family protein molybdopterin-binding subunit [Longimicrobiales bacterium]